MLAADGTCVDGSECKKPDGLRACKFQILRLRPRQCAVLKIRAREQIRPATPPGTRSCPEPADVPTSTSYILLLLAPAVRSWPIASSSVGGSRPWPDVQPVRPREAVLKPRLAASSRGKLHASRLNREGGLENNRRASPEAKTRRRFSYEGRLLLVANAR